MKNMRQLRRKAGLFGKVMNCFQICEGWAQCRVRRAVQIHLRKKQNYRKIFNGVSSIIWAGAFLDFPSVPVRLECKPARFEM